MKERWTNEEDQRLVALVNAYPSTGQRMMWDKIPVSKYWRTPRGTAQRWNHVLKKKCIVKDGKYVLPSTLFDAVEEPKKKAITIPPSKRSVTKKSFLWGLYTITREE
jgi:hypothetical protein